MCRALFEMAVIEQQEHVSRSTVHFGNFLNFPRFFCWRAADNCSKVVKKVTRKIASKRQL